MAWWSTCSGPATSAARTWRPPGPASWTGTGSARSSASTGLDVDDELLDGLLGEAHDHAERRALEDAQRRLVADLGVPTYELPRLPGGVDLGGLYELAALLKAEGMA